ncbi:MAG: type II secretion system minor pseudopilin GspJ [Magnetococcales bacterium]|nr:type II secretion system minor pseudopilin GspJ [Magnetococcales bacterium]
MRGHGQGGFTLLELLIALAIFAVMSVMAYQGLSNLTQLRGELERHSDMLSEVQLAFTILERDLRQALPRSVKDDDGVAQPVLRGQDGVERFLEFSRAGWGNPTRMARSGLQRVVYTQGEGLIRRYYWPVMDMGPGQTLSGGEPLLQEVSRLVIRFLDDKGVWHYRWPPEDGQVTRLPRAIEFTVERRGFGVLQRLFPLS